MFTEEMSTIRFESCGVTVTTYALADGTVDIDIGTDDPFDSRHAYNTSATQALELADMIRATARRAIQLKRG
jgi:hypothetical protein